MENNQNPHSLLVSICNGMVTLENRLSVDYILNMYDSAILLIAIYPREMKVKFTQKPV